MLKLDNKRFRKIYVEITNICNLNCSFCIKTRRAKKYIKTDEFEEILRKIQPYTSLIYLHVKGEPLLHPNLEELLQLCEKYGILVNMTTNAVFIEEKIDVILKSKMLRQINVSLHSIGENENINEQEYLDNIFKSVKKINEKTKILISYRLWNLQDLKQNEQNRSILERIENEYEIENLIDRAKTEKAIKIKPYVYLNQDFEFVWPSLENEVISDSGKCFGLRNQIAILVDGTVVPCCLDQDGDIKLGNIFKETLDEILEKERTKKILKGFRENRICEELCKRCSYREKF